MSIKLRTPSNGSVTLSPQDTASDVVLTVPATSTSVLAGSGFNLSASAPANTFVTTSGGNVGIGTSSPARKLDVAGGIELSSASDQKLAWGISGSYLNWIESGGGPGTTYMRFATGNAEAMRIDSSRNLLVGTTTAVTSGYNGGFISSNPTGSGTAFNVSRNDTASVSTSGLITAYSNFSTTEEKFVVRANGDVQNRTGSYTAYSDERLKENIVDARSYTEDLCKLRVVNYYFKADTIKTKYLGFVAQEVEQVMPGLVFETETDGLQDCKGVKLTVMIPMLIKAIQEQQAMITQLQSRIEALENA